MAIKSVTVYWDTQDYDDKGWAYRVRDDLDELNDTGRVDYSGLSNIKTVVVEIAAEHGIQITNDDVNYDHDDGGVACWIA